MVAYSTLGATTSTTITAVDCQKQVRSWQLLRSLAQLLIPTCNCSNITEQEEDSPKVHFFRRKPLVPSSTVTGTLFGYRHGKVSFCIQTNPKSMSPLLLLELAIPTNVLAKEMKGGSIRIALECEKWRKPGGLLSMPCWTMYCNGRKLGFAVKREPSRADVELFGHVEGVDVGAGIVRAPNHDGVMYLRGKFERCHGSSNSESFHFIDPDHGSVGGQELSFYFLRSQ